MPRTCLIGYTGFIGSNLARQHAFTDLYHSANIRQIEGKTYDLLVCSGVSAAKWRANQAPEEDRAAIDRLLGPLAHVRAARAIQISTIDVYPVTRDVDESFDCSRHSNHAYGKNRLYVENMIKALYSETCIVRLPGVFGPGLKKNVIYDLLHDNCLEAINSASIFQYYDVTTLWNDLTTIQKHGIPLVNLATEPIATHTILRTYFPEKKVGGTAAPAVSYDVRSLHSETLGGHSGYVFDAAQVLGSLGGFIRRQRKDMGS